jgi:hypothetical protein
MAITGLMFSHDSPLGRLYAGIFYCFPEMFVLVPFAVNQIHVLMDLFFDLFRLFSSPTFLFVR